jgi:hypothetical protein
VFLKTTLNKKKLLSPSKLFVTLKCVWYKSLFKLSKKSKKGHQPFQLKPSAIIFSKENSKLCFEALETRLVPQNNLPCWELKTPSEVRSFLQKLKFDFLTNYSI